MEEKKFSALLAASQKMKREEDSSDSGEEPVFDDSSDTDACEDITDDCGGCEATTAGQVRTLCDKWWHANCVTQMDLKDKAQEDLDAMDIQFFCCVHSLAAV